MELKIHCYDMKQVEPKHNIHNQVAIIRVHINVNIWPRQVFVCICMHVCWVQHYPLIEKQTTAAEFPTVSPRHLSWAAWGYNALRKREERQ